MRYKSYADERANEEEYPRLLTAPEVKRPACPLCHKDDYVTPIEVGLIASPEILDPADDIEIDDMARATYTCIDEGYEWNCDRCSIYFEL